MKNVYQYPATLTPAMLVMRSSATSRPICPIVLSSRAARHPAGYAGARTASDAFVPPKAKAFNTAARTGRRWATFGT